MPLHNPAMEPRRKGLLALLPAELILENERVATNIVLASSQFVLLVAVDMRTNFSQILVKALNQRLHEYEKSLNASNSENELSVVVLGDHAQGIPAGWARAPSAASRGLDDLYSLYISQLPTLLAIDATTGFKISKESEELAIEWNRLDECIERWKQGRSALTELQRIRATLTFPTCSLL